MTNFILVCVTRAVSNRGKNGKVEREENVLNQRTRIWQVAAVSIVCLMLTGVAQGLLSESSDEFPVPERLYVAEGPIIYPPPPAGTFQTEILSMSLSGETTNPVFLLADSPRNVSSRQLPRCLCRGDHRRQSAFSRSPYRLPNV